MAEESPAESSELSELRQRLERVEHHLAAVVRHVEFLERQVAPSPPQPTQSPPAASTFPLEPESAEVEAVSPPVGQASPLPAPTWSSTVPRERPPAPARPTAQTIESEIALKWMGRVGVIALVVGAAFFLQYAFSHGWVPPELQVAIGIIAGLVLVVAGEGNRRLERIQFGEALVGGGLAILYVSIYAAFAFFRPALIPWETAFALMAVVTAAGVVLSLRANALSTAVLATLGGFLTPVLVQQRGSGGEGQMLQLFGYILVLDLGILAVSLWRQWRALQYLSFAGTWLMVWGWMGEHYQTSLAEALAGVASVFFITFLIVPVARNVWRRLPTTPEDLFLVIVNPAVYFPTAAGVLYHDYTDYLGLYAFAMAGLYAGLAYTAHTYRAADRLLGLTGVGICVGFAIVAVPLQFHGNWIMVGWAVEAVVLVALGQGYSRHELRDVGLILQTVVAVWGPMLYTSSAPLAPRGPFTPIANETFLFFLVTIASAALSYLILGLTAQPSPEVRQMRSALAVAIAVFGLWGTTAELSRSISGGIGRARGYETTVNFAVSTWWCIYATLLVAVGMARRSVSMRLLGLGVFGLAVLKVFLFDLAFLETIWRVLSFVCLGLILIGVNFLYHVYGETLRSFALAEASAAAAAPDDAPPEEPPG